MSDAGTSGSLQQEIKKLQVQAICCFGCSRCFCTWVDVIHLSMLRRPVWQRLRRAACRKGLMRCAPHSGITANHLMNCNSILSHSLLLCSCSSRWNSSTSSWPRLPHQHQLLLPQPPPHAHLPLLPIPRWAFPNNVDMILLVYSALSIHAAAMQAPTWHHCMQGQLDVPYASQGCFLRPCRRCGLRRTPAGRRSPR